MGESMIDLLSNFEESRQEREAIMIESNVPNAIESAADDRHDCEVRDMIRRFFPHRVETMKAFFGDVEKHRGKAAAEKLKADTRIAWATAKAAA